MGKYFSDLETPLQINVNRCDAGWIVEYTPPDGPIFIAACSEWVDVQVAVKDALEFVKNGAAPDQK
jgi:hypothetical protein